MDSTIFEEAWKNKAKENLADTQKFWDLRAEEFNEITLERDKSKENDDLVDFFLSKGALKEEYDVLDVGCGAGKYSVALAGIVHSVTGIDISPKMIEFSKENCAAKGFNNAEFYTVPWQTLDPEEWKWEKKFDLVFASMSPAVSSTETLLKMNGVSRKHCFMSGFVHREDRVKNFLIKELGGNIDEHPLTNIYYAFNILWQKGIYPDIAYRDRKWTKQWQLDQAVEIFTIQLKKFFPNDQGLSEKVRKLLTEISSEGVVEETIEAKAGWLYWQVR